MTDQKINCYHPEMNSCPNCRHEKINEAVARKLAESQGCAYFPNSLHPTKDYCHSIEAAWEIVEYIAKKQEISVGFVDGNWSTLIAYGSIVGAASAPMAICLAFLKLEDE